MKVRLNKGKWLVSGLVWGLLSTMNSSTALAWGSDGHQIVNRAASKLLVGVDRGFFEANEDNLAKLANTPDTKWKVPATYEGEKPMHFFQWDRYQNSQIANLMPIDLGKAQKMLGEDYIAENGSSPWRAAQIFVLLRDALRAGNCATALQMAGVLGHYVGDLSQPMHNTSDYDGQSINQPGIHRYFETTLVAKQDLDALLAKVTVAGGQPQGELKPLAQSAQPNDVIALTVKESQLSLEDLERLLQDFEQSPRNNRDLADQFGRLMGRGAYVLAKIWDAASTFPAQAS